jgi:hypothetical protein
MAAQAPCAAHVSRARSGPGRPSLDVRFVSDIMTAQTYLFMMRRAPMSSYVVSVRFEHRADERTPVLVSIQILDSIRVNSNSMALDWRTRGRGRLPFYLGRVVLRLRLRHRPQRQRWLWNTPLGRLNAFPLHWYVNLRATTTTTTMLGLHLPQQHRQLGRRAPSVTRVLFC